MQRMWAAAAPYVSYESKVNQDINIGKLPKENYSIQNNLLGTLSPL